MILNDGTATRINKATGNESTPDVSLIGMKLYGKCNWEVCESIGCSDHVPIKITINSSVTHQSILGKAARRKRNGVDWSAYRVAVDAKVESLPPEDNVTKRILRFNKIMTDAAL